MNCTTRLLMHISCRLLIACENEYYTNDKKRQFCSVLACCTPNQIRNMQAVRSTWMVMACEMSITQMIRKRKFCSVFDCYCSTQIRNPIDLNVDRMRNEHYTNDRKKSVLQCFRLLSFKSNTCYAGCPIDLNVCRMRNEHYTYDKKTSVLQCFRLVWFKSNT